MACASSHTCAPLVAKKRKSSDEDEEDIENGKRNSHVLPEKRSKEEKRYEYLDHPADIQLHSWGNTPERAIEALLMSMYGYMTDLDKVDEVYEYHFVGQGRDLDTMIFSFMEEALVAFQSEPFFVAKSFAVTKLDLDNFTVEGYGFGESYDNEKKHSQEADIKAITYSNMQINIGNERTDMYVIVDI